MREWVGPQYVYADAGRLRRLHPRGGRRRAQHPTGTTRAPARQGADLCAGSRAMGKPSIRPRNSLAFGEVTSRRSSDPLFMSWIRSEPDVRLRYFASKRLPPWAGLLGTRRPTGPPGAFGGVKSPAFSQSEPAVLTSQRAFLSRCAKSLRFWGESLSRTAVQAVHPPPLKPPDDDGTEKAEKALRSHRSQLQTRDEAYDELRAYMTGEPSENRSRTVREPLSGSGSGSGSSAGTGGTCPRCRRWKSAGNPDYPGLCGACITREREAAR
jgi:hypothetical protein